MASGSRRYREKLIEQVKRYPVLYDNKHENHRDIDVRDKCWHEISERLGANSEALKREWKILRDSLRQSLKATTRTGAPSKKWRLASSMAFILPYMTKRGARQPIRDDIKMDVSTDTVPEVEEPAVWEPVEAPSQQQHEALELFFASVCQSAKRLPRRLQGQLKQQVLDALLSVEEQADAEQQDSKTALFNNF